MPLLFDIDGTLLHGHGVGRRAVETSLAAWLGRPIDTSAVSFSGKTDPQIFREILSTTEIVGTVPDDLDAAMRLATAAYARDMTERLASAEVEALPGAVSLVQRLAATGHPMGLLTGNLEPLAYLKLNRIGLGVEFPFGAFGSDAEDRDHLPLVAAERASTHFGRSVAPSEFVLIGDTPRDVQAAKAVGARCVAVTTGRYDADALGDADAVLDSLDAFDVDAWT